MPSPSPPALPIDDVLPDLRAAFRYSPNVVLSAPPGAGKTTRVAPALLQEARIAPGRIIMLEPRRLAARRAAEYMSAQRGERAGETVGYRIRGETRVGHSTRIEVVTEGVLTRMLRSAPELPGVSLIIFDEFHERSIHADLGLALSLDVQANLREDLRILVMSATLDGAGIARLLGGAPVIESTGRTYPVETRWLTGDVRESLFPLLLRTIRSALRDSEGDLLVFLPGRREIRRAAILLEEAGLDPRVHVHMLFGEAPAETQDAALAPGPGGTRKIILSTDIAETSLTIDGVRVVIDAGLARTSRFDPRRGMAGLVTGPVSQASADQRRGRAGRQAPGICYRLWTEEQHQSLLAHAPPEILTTDIAALALDLACWGTADGSGLKFLDPPPPSALAAAHTLLRRIGALDAAGHVTRHGRSMADLPVHPRLAHMILRGKELGHGSDACGLAALLESRDPLRGGERTDIDLASRWNTVYGARQLAGHEPIVRESRRLMSLAGVDGDVRRDPPPGLLVALAYPDRIARRRGAEIGRYITAGGTGALAPEWSMLAREEFLAIADIDGAGTEAVIRLAAPLEREDMLGSFSELVDLREEVFWSDRDESVVARAVRMLGAIPMGEAPLTPTPEARAAAVIQGIRRLGIASLPWTPEADSLLQRCRWIASLMGPEAGWPDLSDTALLGTLEQWLGPYLRGVTGRSDFPRIPLVHALRGIVPHAQLDGLDRLAPSHWTTPAGTRVRLDYTRGNGPVAGVRLQEMFGQTDTPLVAGGRARITLHLLSPAGRPLAVTQDLKSFWKNVYPEVRKEMRGRYPKHIWPEDPLAATPTRKTVKKSGR